MGQIVAPMRRLFVVVSFLLAALVPGRAFAAGTPASVLIVIADAAAAATPLQSALLGQGIPVVDVDARPGGPAPALSTLQPYDVVIVWTNSAPSPDGVSWGNVLADYVDGGGDLVLATFAWYGPTFDIDGRIAGPGYSPFDSGALLLSGSQLGAHDALHPIMAGVSSVSAFYNSVTIDPGATLVASWADGVPFVGINASCKVVGINAYPGSNWTGDLMKVFSNASTFFASCDDPPVADAGPDRSVDEQQEVKLDGSGSSDPDGDTLAYAWLQVGGPTVTLFDATTPRPSFTAPFVALGGETLTFELTATANGEIDTDTVSITVVNVNHTPVADAGGDQSIAEGSPVTLDGTSSFDMDGDPISYAWVQMSGPSVTLTGADTAAPSFSAPVVDAGGAPGVVATLVFELVVNDGFPQDAPAPGYTLSDVADMVTIQVTNVNNDPVADSGGDQTVNENSVVVLNGSASSDPDGDALTFAWTQIGGPPVALTGETTATPSLTTPLISPGGADLTFQLTVHDAYGGTASDSVVVHVQNANDPPLVSAARPTIACLWPPNHSLVLVGITGVSDPDDIVTIVIDRVTQDEPTSGLGDGDTAVDAIVNADGTVLLRAERAGSGNGRVYHVHFTASNPGGSATGMVTVCVPHNRNASPIDGGELFESTD